MSKASRIVIGITAASLILLYFLPFWAIHLIAPQYPEGLTMYIWLNKLTGEVAIINGLNHYIGMGKISEEMFPELRFLVYVVGAFIGLTLLVAVVGSRRWLLFLLIATVLGAIAALADMYRWGYGYGHNLDPTAPIQVPGMAYQPPLIGHKKLLNFDAYSYPAEGGWVFIVAALIFLTVYVLEVRRAKKAVPHAHHTKPIAA